MTSEIRKHLRSLYGRSAGDRACDKLEAHLTGVRVRGGLRPWKPDQRDAFLITYPDQIREAGVPPLRTLASFLEQHVDRLFTGLHVLPFFPASSDEGYSVMDYKTVDSRYGDWRDIETLGRSYQLMVDAVINHASVKGTWFSRFLKCDPGYVDYFVTVAGRPDLSAVVRPRESPLLTDYVTADGTKRVWTTFGPDQADLNYGNPEVLLEMIDILLFYVARGFDLIRLDAIAYIWKEIGTACIHLPQTYTVLRLLRAILDVHAPGVALITETNVPHAENMTYLGNGHDLAHMVYNFTLPPLVLHAVVRGTSHALSGWLSSLTQPPGDSTFLNFLASHDGIGLQPLRGLLPDHEIGDFVRQFEAAGGLVSYKTGLDGGRSPYELNMNYFDALSWAHRDDSEQLQVGRFLTAHAILLSVMGVPAVYFHSLVGSRGWMAGPSETGQYRSINRERLRRDQVEIELADSTSRRAIVHRGLSALVRARAGSPAFHPKGRQETLDAGSAILAIRRTSPSGKEHVLCLSNLSAATQTVAWNSTSWGDPPRTDATELIAGVDISATELSSIALRAYETVWLRYPSQ